MKFSALLSVVFFTAFSLCDCADLEVLINGMRTTSCVGETVTYMCTVASNTHIWNITGLEDEVTVAGGSNDVEEGVFTIGSDGLTNGILTSYVIVSSFPGLDGVLLRCRDGTGTQGLEEQTTTAMVFGSTSDPRLTVMSSLTSFILTPQAPVNNSQCVTDYTIIPAGDGVVREDIPVAIEDLGVAIRVDGYDVCLYTYNFTIVATTPAGELRRTVPQDDPIDLSDAAPITGLVETRSGLAWSRPVNAIECSFDYMVTDDDDSELIMTDDISYNGTFPVCHNQTITVTPMVPITGQELTSSSASITGIFNSSADIVGIKPEVVVSSSVRLDGDEVDINITWILQGVGTTNEEFVVVTRDDAGDPINRTAVDGNPVGTHTVMDCNYEETSTTFFVRFISGDCMSEESNATDGFIDELDCTGEPEGGDPDPIGGIVGGLVGVIVAVAVVMAAIIGVTIYMKKRSGKPCKEDGREPKVTYHSSGATAGAGAGVYESDPTATDGPGLYADPKAIEHQVAGPGGEEYALVTTKKKQPEPVPTGDLYSVPDKSKKTQNQGLVYADIDVKNPTRPPPAAPRGHAFQPDNEPVMYSTVNM